MNKIEQQVVQDQRELAQKYRDKIEEHKVTMKELERALSLVESFIKYLTDGNTPSHKELPGTATILSFRAWLRTLAFTDGAPHNNNELTGMYNKYRKRNYTPAKMSVKIAECLKLGTIRGYKVPDLKVTYYGPPSFFNGEELKPEYMDKIRKAVTV